MSLFLHYELVLMELKIRTSCTNNPQLMILIGCGPMTSNESRFAP